MAKRDQEGSGKFNSIVDMDAIPPNPHYDNDPCDVYIVADDVLASQDGERVIRLRPDALALNGLLKTRDRWASGPEVRDAANLLVGSSGFAYRLTLLRDDLQQVADVDNPVEAQGEGKGRAYRLSPRFHFYDKRSEGNAYLKQFGIIGECVTLDEYDEANEAHRVRFDSSDDRRNFLSSLFKQYATSPEVLSAYRELFDLGYKQHGVLPELPPEDILTHFLTIERGAVAFAQPAQTEETEKAGTDAVIAYHTLLLSTVALIQSQASIYGRAFYNRLNDELFQQGCESVIKVIMDAGEGDLEKLSDYFYKKCSVSAGYTMLHALNRDRQKTELISERNFEVWRATWNLYGVLAQKLQREPSPAEIAAEIEADGLSREGIEDAVYSALSDRGSVSIDAFEDYGENLLIQYRHYDNEIDRELAILDLKDMVDKVFETSELDDREKIVLSLLHDVYRTDLAGAVFKNRNEKVPFEYPMDRETFDAIAHKIGGRVLRLGEVVKSDKARVSRMVRGAYTKAQVVLRDEM